uniref:Uncharacterized protein n=1 Tax=Neobodo designis TaxID=312471 RepID=A0A7S1Q542_NEODS
MAAAAASDTDSLSSSVGSAEFDERRVAEYLESRRDAMTAAMRQLLECMLATHTTRVVLANSPHSNLRLPVVERDTPKSGMDSGLGVDAVVGSDGSGDFTLPIWVDQARPFLSDCWRAAGGADAAVKCLVRDEDIDELCDLDTGEEEVC